MSDRLPVISHFTQLATYQLAADLRRGVFETSKRWPLTERYSLTSQIRRSSRGVGAAIAEAWAKRRFPRHFVAKLTDALGEAQETLVWLDVAKECGYLPENAYVELSVCTRRVCSGLVRMVRRPDQWCIPLSGRFAGRGSQG
jgi:four helix bundle protein